MPSGCTLFQCCCCEIIFHQIGRAIHIHITITSHFIHNRRSFTECDAANNRGEVFLPCLQLLDMVDEESTINVFYRIMTRCALFRDAVYSSEIIATCGSFPFPDQLFSTSRGSPSYYIYTDTVLPALCRSVFKPSYSIQIMHHVKVSFISALLTSFQPVLIAK